MFVMLSGVRICAAATLLMMAGTVFTSANECNYSEPIPCAPRARITKHPMPAAQPLPPARPTPER
jgi:hypothetical protein